MVKVKRLVKAMVKRAIALGGTCTGEHGVGIGKREYLYEELGFGTVELMKKIKRTVDPLNLFNPGKVSRRSPCLVNLFLYLTRAGVPRFATGEHPGGFTTMTNGIPDRRSFCFLFFSPPMQTAARNAMPRSWLLSAVYLRFGIQRSATMAWHRQEGPRWKGDDCVIMLCVHSNFVPLDRFH